MILMLRRRRVWLASGLALFVIAAVVGAMALRTSEADRAMVGVHTGMTYGEAKAAIGHEGRRFEVVSDFRGYTWNFNDDSWLTMWVDRNEEATLIRTSTPRPFEW